MESILIGDNKHCTVETITNDYNAYKTATDKSSFNLYDFVGGWEVDSSTAEAYKDKLVHQYSLDDTKCFLHYGDYNNGTQCTSKSNESFIELADALGISNIHTKSEAMAIIHSAEYSPEEL